MPKLSSMIECNPIRNILVMLYGNSKPDMMRYNLPLWFLPCLIITMMFDEIETIVRKYGRAMRYFQLLPLWLQEYSFRCIRMLPCRGTRRLPVRWLFGLLVGLVFKRQK